jgi:hypothetical protein
MYHMHFNGRGHTSIIFSADYCAWELIAWNKMGLIGDHLN